MGKKEFYDPDVRDELEDEYGDPNTATLIASTEMDGVAHDEDGNLDATQTYCNKLEYPEQLEVSPAMKEGQKKCEDELGEFLEKEGLESVDDWIKREERKKAEQASSTTS